MARRMERRALVTALVADPSAAPRRAAGFLLESLGFRVAMAATMEEALALAKGLQPDLVLADARLEGAEGGSPVEALRTVSDACLFHVTADGGAAGVRRAVEAGADDYLVKPFDAALLDFKLAQARSRGRLAAKPSSLRLVQDNAAAGDTSWRFQLFGKAV
jgi:two-component system chemotaxis response regulator CheY